MRSWVWTEQEREAKKEATVLSKPNLGRDIPSLLEYLLVTQTYPGIMWEGTTQGYGYQEADIIEKHLRGWLPKIGESKVSHVTYSHLPDVRYGRFQTVTEYILKEKDCDFFFTWIQVLQSPYWFFNLKFVHVLIFFGRLAFTVDVYLHTFLNRLPDLMSFFKRQSLTWLELKYPNFIGLLLTLFHTPSSAKLVLKRLDMYYF